MKCVLKIMQNNKLEGKIVVLESLVSSKLIFHFHMSNVPNDVACELQSMQNLVLWKTSNPKMKIIQMVV